MLDLSSEGYSLREIAQKLQLDKSTVHSDIKFLRLQAQENIQRHIHEIIPEEYQRCMTGMKRNLKQTLEIAETTADPRIKLQARAIANDCYKYIMELTADGAIISDAMKHVESKVSKLKQNTANTTTADKVQLEQVQDTEVEAAEATTNGVF